MVTGVQESSSGNRVFHNLFIPMYLYNPNYRRETVNVSDPSFYTQGENHPKVILEPVPMKNFVSSVDVVIHQTEIELT